MPHCHRVGASSSPAGWHRVARLPAWSPARGAASISCLPLARQDEEDRRHDEHGQDQATASGPTWLGDEGGSDGSTRVHRSTEAGPATCEHHREREARVVHRRPPARPSAGRPMRGSSLRAALPAGAGHVHLSRYRLADRSSRVIATGPPCSLMGVEYRAHLDLLRLGSRYSVGTGQSWKAPVSRGVGTPGNDVRSASKM
jgi:hypothetical protein